MTKIDSCAENVLLDVHALTRTLGGGGPAILDGITLQIDRGELIALTGASGSGKSTLLYLLGVLDRPTSGAILLDGVDVSALDDDERAALRNEQLGFVFQFHFLLPELDVLENVTLPMLRRGLSREEAEEIARAVLDDLDLADLSERRPGQLSGGQQQRVSIARAVAHAPSLVLADEPTGNLDSRNAERVFQIFVDRVRRRGQTVVMVTHDPELARRADRCVTLKDGRVASDFAQSG